MHHVSPITAAEVRPYNGGPIRAMLLDGSEVAGYVRGVENGRLLIGGRPPHADTAASIKRKAGKQSGKSGARNAKKLKPKQKQKQNPDYANVAASSAYPVTMRPGGIVALDLSYVAAFVAERAERK